MNPLKTGMITQNFSWQEAMHTSHREIENEFTDDIIIYNIASTASHMEDVRYLLDDKQIIVSSWYRCPELNAAVGGAKNSDHMIGCAVDFICPQIGSPAEVAKILARHAPNLGFKQLILEHTWVHISWDAIPNTNPKMEVLSLLAGGGYAKGLTTKDGKLLA